MQKNQTPIWNLIFYSLESAISYKFLIIWIINGNLCLKNNQFTAFCINIHNNFFSSYFAC